MNPLALAQDLFKQLENVESTMAVTALRMAILAIENHSYRIGLSGLEGDYLRKVSGEPIGH